MLHSTLPLRLRSALINESVSIVLKVSRWMAHDARQVKISPQRLSSFRLSLISQGPNTSIPV